MENKGKKLDKFDVAQVKEIIKLLKNAGVDADNASKTYSKDTQSKLAFEVGYLNSYCKTAAEILEDIIK